MGWWAPGKASHEEQWPSTQTLGFQKGCRDQWWCYPECGQLEAQLQGTIPSVEEDGRKWSFTSSDWQHHGTSSQLVDPMQSSTWWWACVPRRVGYKEVTFTGKISDVERTEPKGEWFTNMSHVSFYIWKICNINNSILVFHSICFDFPSSLLEIPTYPSLGSAGSHMSIHPHGLGCQFGRGLSATGLGRWGANFRIPG